MNNTLKFDPEWIKGMLEAKAAESPVLYDRGRIRFDGMKVTVKSRHIRLELLWHGTVHSFFEYPWSCGDGTFTLDLTDVEASTTFKLT